MRVQGSRRNLVRALQTEVQTLRAEFNARLAELDRDVTLALDYATRRQP